MEKISLTCVLILMRSLTYVLIWMKIWWALKKTFTHYLLHNINIDGNIVGLWRTFIHLIDIERVRSKM